MPFTHTHTHTLVQNYTFHTRAGAHGVAVKKLQPPRGVDGIARVIVEGIDETADRFPTVTNPADLFIFINIEYWRTLLRLISILTLLTDRGQGR